MQAIKHLLFGLLISGSLVACVAEPDADDAVILVGGDENGNEAATVDELDPPAPAPSGGGRVRDGADPIAESAITSEPKVMPTRSGAERGSAANLAYEASPNGADEPSDDETGDDYESDSPRDRYDAPPRRAPAY